MVLMAQKGYFLILLVTAKMLEHYEKAAKALGLDLDKIYMDCVRPLVREELTRDQWKKMRKEMK
jgi:hypothetical protein